MPLSRIRWSFGAALRAVPVIVLTLVALASLISPLARQQGELGRQQERASKRANLEMRRLAEDAIASGKAKRLRN